MLFLLLHDLTLGNYFSPVLKSSHLRDKCQTWSGSQASPLISTLYLCASVRHTSFCLCVCASTVFITHLNCLRVHHEGTNENEICGFIFNF